MSTGYLALTDAERQAIGDALGQLVTFFIDSNREACKERDEALARAEKAERQLARILKPDGEVLETLVSR